MNTTSRGKRQPVKISKQLSVKPRIFVHFLPITKVDEVKSWVQIILTPREKKNTIIVSTDLYTSVSSLPIKYQSFAAVRQLELNVDSQPSADIIFHQQKVCCQSKV